METEDDQAGDNGFRNSSLMYKADVNDPSLSNAS